MAFGRTAQAAMLFVSATLQALAINHANALHLKLLTPGNNPTCETYTAERATSDSQSLQFWLLGFLSAASLVGNQDRDILANIDGNAAWAWMDKYCLQHPIDPLYLGASALYRDLLNRQQ